ncbi:hypothetical protein BS78_10G262200 [Paspalum vaginatum]|nr:hypothetical protein BS78_10G262200 [Paspalum vaginatum]
MQQAAAAPPPPAPRRRVYTAVDPRCEWTSTDDADTLIVDVSGFRKEELKVLYNTGRKLKVAGERQVDGRQWARFLKVFPVPRSYDAGTIQAKMNIESARLLVILPKGTSSSKDKQKEHGPETERTQSLGELMRLGARDDPGSGKVEEKEQSQDQAPMEEPKRDHAMTIQDLPRGDRSDAAEKTVKNDDGGGSNATDLNAARDGDGDGKGEDKRWWRKITVVHVLGFVLVLALVGVGATVLYIVLM